jgi:hypothetical protein
METLEPFGLITADAAEFLAVQAEVLIAHCVGPALSPAGRRYMLALYDKLQAVSPFNMGVCEAAQAVRERG